MGHVLPAQASAEIADVTEPHMTREEMQAELAEARQQVIESLTPDEVAAFMKAIPVAGSDLEETD